MATYFNPRQEMHNSSGIPYNGALAYFYITGTDTLKSVYTNEGLTIAHANPVVADAAGHWAAIFLNTDVAYKVVVKDSAGNTIYTDDPVRPVPLYTDFSTMVTHAYRAANSPVRYGALGDGVADESSMVQSAITNATGTVDLLGLTYRCDSQITVPSNRRIINGVLNFANCSATDGYLKCTGALGALQACSAVAAGATQINSTLTPSNVSAGDLLILQAQDTFGATTGRAEFIRPRTVGANLIDLESRIGDMAYNSSPKYAVVSPVSRVVFKDLRIIGATSGTRYGIYLTYCEGIEIIDCAFESIATAALSAIASIDISAINCRSKTLSSCAVIRGCERVNIDGWRDEGYYINSGTRVSFTRDTSTLMFSSRCTLSNSTLQSYYNSGGVGIVNIGDGAHDIHVRGCHLNCGQYGVVMAPAVGDIFISENVIKNFTNEAIYITAPSGQTCKNVRVAGNRVESAIASAAGILVISGGASAVLEDWRFEGNTIRLTSVSGGGPCIFVDMTTGNTTEIRRLKIRGNNCYINGSGNGIHVRSSASATAALINQLTICENNVRLENSSGFAILVERRHATPTVIGVVITGNTAYQGIIGIQVESCDDVVIAGNELRSVTNNGVKFYNDLAATNTGLVILGNIINNPATGIEVAATLSASSIVNDVSIAGNVMTGVTSRGIYINASSSGVIANLSMTGNVSNCDGDTQAAIDATCANVADVTNVAATGNVAVNGTYGLRFSANCTVIVAAGNSGASLATGGVTGADTVDGTNNPV